MKLLIAALLFVAIGTITAQSNGYTRLSTATINRSQLIQGLRQLGAEYLLEKAIFQTTKNPLRNGNWNISRTESVYRRISGGVNYYRFTVILASKSSPTTVRGLYTVSFRPSNGNTAVTSYSYRILSDKDEFRTDQPQFVDLTWLTSNTYIQAQFQKGYDFTVANAIKNGEIRDATYHAGKTFSIRDSGYTYPPVINFLTTLVTRSGYTYRVRFFVPDLESVPEDQQANYPITYWVYPNN